jgi:hypothetical protein
VLSDNNSSDSTAIIMISLLLKRSSANSIFLTILWSSGTRDRKPGSISRFGIFQIKNIVHKIINAMIDLG